MLPMKIWANFSWLILTAVSLFVCLWNLQIVQISTRSLWYFVLFYFFLIILPLIKLEIWYRVWNSVLVSLEQVGGVSDLVSDLDKKILIIWSSHLSCSCEKENIYVYVYIWIGNFQCLLFFFFSLKIFFFRQIFVFKTIFFFFLQTISLKDLVTSSTLKSFFFF